MNGLILLGQGILTVSFIVFTANHASVSSELWSTTGEKIWGRGSFDDKSGLIGLMYAYRTLLLVALGANTYDRTTVETLIKSGFKPTRGITLAFGFDEEASGLHVSQLV